MNNKINKQQSGFTLLELIVVISIIGLITSLATDFMVNETNQNRYNLTQQRLQQIRYAIVGDSSRSLNGHPVFSGYIADTGHIPKYLRDLVSNGYCTNAAIDNQPACLSVSAKWREQNNWKGPYLQASGYKDLCNEEKHIIARIPTFRDGWGSHQDFNCAHHDVNDALNFGWEFTITDRQNILITSFGLNGPSAVDPVKIDSPDYLYEKDTSIRINASQYRGTKALLQIANTSDKSIDHYCLQSSYPDGSSKTIDLRTEHSIPSGNIFGLVSTNVLRKTTNNEESCSSARIYTNANVSSFFAHNLYPLRSGIKVDIKAN